MDMKVECFIVIFLFLHVHAECAQKSKMTQLLSTASSIRADHDYYPSLSMSSSHSSTSMSAEYDNYDYLGIHHDQHKRQMRPPISKKPQIKDDRIVYPESETCEFGLCFNVNNYPKERVMKVLSRIQIVDNYFGEEVPDIGNRFNDNETPLCGITEKTVYPEKANNTMQQERIIVNVEGHKQGITYEVCTGPTHCKFSEGFPQQYKSKCKQKYIHKRLLVLEGEKVVVDTFEVPSCCVCILETKT